MAKSHIGCALLTLVVAGAWAQPAKEPVEVVKVAAAEPVRVVDVQQRRAALRAMLKAQPELAAARETNAARQLSPQERADLREQLRQQ